MTFVGVLGWKYVALPFDICQGLSGLLFYQVGTCCKKYDLFMKMTRWWIPLIGSLVWVVGSKYWMMDMSACDYDCYPVNILVALAGFVMIWGISQLLNLIPVMNNYWAWVGKCSLAFFVVHNFDIMLGLTSGYNGWLRLLINLVVATTLIWLYEQVEQKLKYV